MPDDPPNRTVHETAHADRYVALVRELTEWRMARAAGGISRGAEGETTFPGFARDSEARRWIGVELEKLLRLTRDVFPEDCWTTEEDVKRNTISRSGFAPTRRSCPHCGKEI